MVIWENRFGRVTSFDTLGAVVRLRHLDLGLLSDLLRFGGNAQLALPLRDGSFVAQASPSSPGPGEMPLGILYRAPITYVRIRSDYSADTLGWYHGMARCYFTYPGLGVLPLFPVRSSIVASQDPLMLFVTNADGSGVRMFDSEGMLVRIIRRRVPPLPIGLEERERFLAELGETTYARRARACAEQQRHHPEMAAIIVDLANHVWAFERESVPGWADWNVFELNGTWLGPVSLPRMRILEVGMDYVLGLWRDEAGVESVREYRLDRSGNVRNP